MINILSKYSPNLFISLFSFSKENSTILKGYGILFMIFHHCFGLNALPSGVDINWVTPEIIKFSGVFKICVSIFIFITGYALGLKTYQHPSPFTFLERGVSHYIKFWKTYLLCLLLVILISWVIPTPGLTTPDHFGWEKWIFAFSGLFPPYFDWWYMGLFAFGSLILYPVASLITNRKTPVIALINLLLLSLLLHLMLLMVPSSAFYRDIILFSPLFVFGYTCALITNTIGNMSRKEYYIALLVLLLEICLIHFLAFSSAKKWTFPFLFTIWILPWLTKKIHLTNLLMLLGSYSALMWLNHRFIFGYHFSQPLYGTHSYFLVYGLTLLGSFLLAVAMQWTFQKIFRQISLFWKMIVKKTL